MKLRSSYIIVALFAAFMVASVLGGDHDSKFANERGNNHYEGSHNHYGGYHHGGYEQHHGGYHGGYHGNGGHWHRKLMGSAADTQTAWTGGKGRSLLNSNRHDSAEQYGYGAWNTELVPHGDHLDRVAVYDTTRASPWENAHHYSHGWRKLMSMLGLAQETASIPRTPSMLVASTAAAPNTDSPVTASLMSTPSTDSQADADVAESDIESDDAGLASDSGRRLLQADTPADAQADSADADEADADSTGARHLLVPRKLQASNNHGYHNHGGYHGGYSHHHHHGHYHGRRLQASNNHYHGGYNHGHHGGYNHGHGHGHGHYHGL